MTQLQSAGASNWIILVAMMLLMVYIFYQNIRREKEQRKFVESLKKGDRVVMKSGLYGRVSETNGSTIVVETMSGKLIFDRNAVSMEFTKARTAEAKEN